MEFHRFRRDRPRYSECRPAIVNSTAIEPVSADSHITGATATAIVDGCDRDIGCFASGGMWIGPFYMRVCRVGLPASVVCASMLLYTSMSKYMRMLTGSHRGATALSPRGSIRGASPHRRSCTLRARGGHGRRIEI